MNLDQLANLGEFIGGIAVLVTLIYLAVQVKHTRNQVNEQGVGTALETMQVAFDPVYEGDNLSIFRRGVTGADLQNEDEAFLFGLLMTRIVTGAMSCSRTEDPTCDEYLAMVKERVFDLPGARAWIAELPTESVIRRAVDEAFERP